MIYLCVAVTLTFLIVCIKQSKKIKVLSNELDKQIHQMDLEKSILIHKNESETAATVERIEKEKSRTIAKIADQAQRIVNQVEEKKKLELETLISSKDQAFENLESQYKNTIEKKDQYIKALEKYKRNKGETLAHMILIEIKNNFVKSGAINEDEMIILGNVFIPTKFKDQYDTRQIDHLVLLPTGIYVIETKHWIGKILHGYSKKAAGEYSFILEMMYPKLTENEEKTIVIRNDDINTREENSRDGELKIVSYGDPAKQVLSAAMCLKEFLEQHDEKFNWVQAILYFGYRNDGLNEVVNFTTKKYPDVLTSETDLRSYFEKELVSKRKRYRQKDLKKIKDIIILINDIS
ncbi:nuclease-related domain-containing protein [Bacillus atrophaeus]|uniref:nuclease-related domain-containing protein n=1 Tax=Bacillus atrophaeus TaxID=1452 RepID=UPI002E1CC798|nr:nuclease-related domain-containing protein [Bacillus atrophaeus]